jgi:hypothetical protein
MNVFKNLLSILGKIEWRSIMVEFKPLIYTAFGWVLGLLSTFSVQWLNKRRLEKDLRRSLCSQLKDALLRVSATYYTMCRNLGRADREVLQWTYSMRRATGESIAQQVEEATEFLFNQSDEVWRVLSLIGRQTTGTHSHIKKFRIPYLEVNLPSIGLLESNLQSFLFDVLTKINWLNEAIDRNNFYYEKTFDSNLSRENWDIIHGNIIEGYEKIGNLCRDTAEAMVKIVKELSK